MKKKEFLIVCFPFMLALVSCGGDSRDRERAERSPEKATVKVFGEVRSHQGDVESLGGIQLRVLGLKESRIVDVDSNGEFVLETDQKESIQNIRLEFFGQSVVDSAEKITIPASATSYRVSTTLMPAGQTYGFSLDRESIIQTDSKRVTVTVPKNAFRFEDGSAAVGGAEVKITEVDLYGGDKTSILAAPDLMGVPQGSDIAGVEPQPIYSFGMSKFDFSQSGKKLVLRDGMTVEIKMPLNNAMIYSSPGDDTPTTPASDGDLIPMWYFDSEAQVWREEGKGTVVPDTSVESGFSIVGDVSHFTWWNYDEVCPMVKVKVVVEVYDTVTKEPINDYVSVDSYSVRAYIDQPGFHGGAPWKARKRMTPKNNEMSLMGNKGNRGDTIITNPNVSDWTTVNVDLKNIVIDGELVDGVQLRKKITPVQGKKNILVFKVPYEFIK